MLLQQRRQRDIVHLVSVLWQSRVGVQEHQQVFGADSRASIHLTRSSLRGDEYKVGKTGSDGQRTVGTAAIDNPSAPLPKALQLTQVHRKDRPFVQHGDDDAKRGIHGVRVSARIVERPVVVEVDDLESTRPDLGSRRRRGAQHVRVANEQHLQRRQALVTSFEVCVIPVE